MPPVPEPECQVQKKCFTSVLTTKQGTVCTPLASYKRQLSIHNLPQKVKDFVKKSAALCQPDDIHIMDGSQGENQWLLNKLTNEGTLIKLTNHKNCYLARTDPKDVARVESRTFICSSSRRNSVCTPRATDSSSHPPKSSLGNFMPLDEADRAVQSRFPGCMKGRVMYVIPFSMGPVGGPLSKIGVQVTDSAYVATSMRIMTRLGTPVVDQLEKDAARGNVEFVKCLHSVGKCDEATKTWPCDPERVLILHKPETNEIISYGSGYGGNSLLGKKCFALRIGSTIAQKEGWLAEHMLILGITPPSGQKVYIAAAFPSACGKTNLAMMNPSLPGYKVECIGDDIAWIKYNPKTGMLHAINPENGFFGVAPGTNWKTNPNAMKSMTENTLYTNVALTSNGSVWWEGMEEPADSIVITDWRGRPWVKGETKEPAAHPNSRFTAPCSQCPIIDPDWESPEGVPLSAVLFGGRRPQGVPLVFEALSWEHGVLIGASMRSEATAAASDVTAGSRLLHDPFAMRPFFGYNFGKYLEHWLSMKTRFGPEVKLPKIFHVNWFRKDSKGNFLWPGFGENIRVLDWVINRLHVSEDGNAVKTPIGYVPREESINLKGLDDSKKPNMRELLSVPSDFWKREVEDIENYLQEQVNIDLPEKIMQELSSLKQRLNH